MRRGYTCFGNIGTFQLFMWFISTGKTMVYKEHYLVICKMRLATTNMGDIVLKGAPLTSWRPSVLNRALCLANNNCVQNLSSIKNFN